jgi:hypothetical protein
MERWPDSWRIDDTDVAIGREFVELFEGFLVELYLQGLSTRTINRHRGNLWVLGGELMRRRSAQSVPSHWPARKILSEYLFDDGEPMLVYGSTDTDQGSFDTTCRKLFDFLPGEQGAT